MKWMSMNSANSEVGVHDYEMERILLAGHLCSALILSTGGVDCLISGDVLEGFGQRDSSNADTSSLSEFIVSGLMKLFNQKLLGKNRHLRMRVKGTRLLPSKHREASELRFFPQSPSSLRNFPLQYEI